MTAPQDPRPPGDDERGPEPSAVPPPPGGQPAGGQPAQESRPGEPPAEGVPPSGPSPPAGPPPGAAPPRPVPPSQPGSVRPPGPTPPPAGPAGPGAPRPPASSGEGGRASGSGSPNGPGSAWSAPGSTAPSRPRPPSPPPLTSAGPPRPAPPPVPSDEPGGGADDYEDNLSRWVSILTTVGIALVAVVTAQVVASVLEGFLIREARMEPRGVETDLLHRLGFPFGNLGPPVVLFLIAGLALMSLPGLFDVETTPLQDRMIGVTLVAIIVLAVIISAGSLLAVRNLLHEFSASGQSPPPFTRAGFAVFLLGTLGSAAIALFGSLAAINARRRRRTTA